uniref:Uncharacterized protein n=1 Tax=Urocitellus parryii TaxID=9999 RepID=A0A8D2HAE1_UROPR
MAYGQQKIHCQQNKQTNKQTKNNKKLDKRRNKNVTQKATAQAAFIYTRTICRTQMPDLNNLKTFK